MRRRGTREPLAYVLGDWGFRRLVLRTDRRALVLRPTPGSDEEVRKTLGAMHERMIAAAGALSEDEAETVIGFLEGIRAAVDQIEPAKHA